MSETGTTKTTLLLEHTMKRHRRLTAWTLAFAILVFVLFLILAIALWIIALFVRDDVEDVVDDVHAVARPLAEGVEQAVRAKPLQRLVQGWLDKRKS